jgi:hypothetical protein
MKRRLISCLFILCLLFPAVSNAAGTMTVAIDNPQYMTMGNKTFPCRITIDWTSTDGGAVSGDIAATFTASKKDYEPALTAIRGKFQSAQFIPGKGGDLATDLPTNLYDVTITDAYGQDILGAQGGDRSGTESDIILEGSGQWRIDSELTLTIAAAGNATKGRIIIMLGE